ncbi:MAG: hypothetical protein ACUVV3_01905 [Dehalococcoidia bacterium]
MSDRRKAKRRLRKRVPAAAREDAAAGDKGRSGLRDKIAILIAAAVLIPVVAFTVLNFYRSDGPDQPSAAPTVASPAAGPRAAIVDHLSLTQPNPAFAEAVTKLLEQAGYTVDYYPGEEVTVEFYRQLPAWGHDLIILRVHSAQGKVGDRPADWVTLFTADSYDDTWYKKELGKRRLSRVSYYKGGPQYFGIMPDFIKSSMESDFNDAMIVVMGCDGLTSDSLAEAFVQKGAKAVVAWDGLVSSEHTDAATERLLRHLLVEGLTIHEAVTQTMAEVDADPSYGSVMHAYP